MSWTQNLHLIINPNLVQSQKYVLITCVYVDGHPRLFFLIPKGCVHRNKNSACQKCGFFSLSLSIYIYILSFFRIVIIERKIVIIDMSLIIR